MKLFPFKKCSCGKTYSKAEWEALPLLGCQPTEEDDFAYVLEMKNCTSCGSTITIEHKYERKAKVMKVEILVVSGGKGKVRGIEPDDFPAIQEIVGGWVERIDLRHFGKGLAMLVNEDGRSLGLPEQNTPFYPDPIRGNYVIVREGQFPAEGFIPLLPGEAESFKDLLTQYAKVTS